MNLELLPNEIILDLFGYFNGVDLLPAFYGLNSRFNYLLYKQFRHYSFGFSSIRKHDFDIICQKHLPFVADQVIALRLCDWEDTPEEINLFFTYISSFSQFIQLRSLSLSNIQSYQILIKFINECQYLYNLTRLNFSCYSLQNCEIDFQLIIDTLWSLPKLRYCNLTIRIKEQESFCTPTKISSTLEYVYIYGYTLKWNQMNRFFEYTPRLKRLSIFIASSDDDDYIPSSLSSLIDLTFAIFRMSNTSKMISFLQNIPNLRRLDINLCSTLINGYQWEQIIRNYLPMLKVFRLKMKDTFPLNENIQERVDQLIDSFRSSFWINEHQWFVRCITVKTTIYLNTLSNSFDDFESKFPDSFRSTYPADNLQNCCNNMTSIYNETFFDQTIPSDIYLPNINYLRIKLPINNKFWSIVPSLKRLYSLNISFYADTFQSQLQTLLDRAPCLRYLLINQDESLPLQMSSFKYTNASVSILDFRKCNYWFNEEECMTLCHSPLGIQCQVLFIHVKNREIIIILVKNMINLRALHIECKDEKFNKRSTPTEIDNDEFRDEDIENKDVLVQWLNDQLPSTCLAVKESFSTSLIRIWI